MLFILYKEWSLRACSSAQTHFTGQTSWTQAWFLFCKFWHHSNGQLVPHHPPIMHHRGMWNELHVQHPYKSPEGTLAQLYLDLSLSIYIYIYIYTYMWVCFENQVPQNHWFPTSVEHCESGASSSRPKDGPGMTLRLRSRGWGWI